MFDSKLDALELIRNLSPQLASFGRAFGLILNQEFCEKVDFTTAEKTPGELNGEDCDGTSIAPFA